MGLTPLFVGIDLGTSGCRAVAIDRDGAVRGAAEMPLPPPVRIEGGSEQDPDLWWTAVRGVLEGIARQIPAGDVRALSVDGTSGTLLLADAEGRPLTPALMYDDGRSLDETASIARVAPRDSAAHGTGSGLAKLLHLQPRAQGARHAVHQADWVLGRLSGRWGISDENNCLKLGYDPVRREWPAWMDHLGVDRGLLPDVVRAGTTVGSLQEPAILALGYPSGLRITTGTTDSVAAFIATGAHAVGDAVTSLGSTLVLKVLSASPVFSPEYGIYSHPLGDLWLAGGGSNSGGAVLLQYFKSADLVRLTPLLRPDHPTGLDYYPLARRGERFPVCDPGLEPRLSPRPADDAAFLQGMLEGMARIELAGYRRLAELGAPWPRRLMTVGGGARNPAWTRIRQQLLDVPFAPPRSDQACYGAALLALSGS